MPTKITNRLDSAALQNILRVTREPLRQFTDSQVHDLLCADLPGYLQYLKSALGELAGGRASVNLPEKLLFQQPGESGDFRVMPCVRTTASGRLYKTVKLVGTNRHGQRVPDQISVGKACYLDPLENYVSHQFDACLLSSIRTGACAALAQRYLQSAHHPPRTINLVGAGRVGFYTTLCLLSDHHPASLTITDLQPERATQLVEALQKIVPHWHITHSPYADLADCELLILATTSERPIYHPDDFHADLVISLGADCREQRELHSHSRWQQQPLFVDTKDSLRYGDLAAWNPDGKSLIDLIDLAALSSSATPTAYPALFISTGSALLDNLTISYLVELTAETEDEGQPAEITAETR